MTSTDLDEGRVAEALGYVHRWVDYRQRTLHLPGIAYAVARHGRVLQSGAFGVADVTTGAALTVDHVFRVASQSKMFTATAVMRLVEAGRLRLEAALGDVLEDVPGELSSVTVRELLAHGSGVIRDGRDAAFWELQADFPDRAGLAGMLDGGRVLARNERYKYSNVGFALLGRVIEQVSGQTYDAHLRASVLEPLGLSSTTADLEATVADRLASGHSSGRGGAVRMPLPHVAAGAFAAATGFCSTVADMAAFSAAHCHGDTTLLSDDAKRTLHQVQWPVPGEKDHHYALGFTAYDVGGQRWLGHNGAYPGFITGTRFEPASGLAVVVMTNSIDGPAAEVAHGVIKLVALAHEGGSEAAADGVDRFTGRFAGLWATYDVVRLGGGLVAMDPAAPDPTERLFRLTVESETSARLTEVPGAGPYGEPVELLTDAAGEVTGLRWAGLPLTRQPPPADHGETRLKGQS